MTETPSHRALPPNRPRVALAVAGLLTAASIGAMASSPEAAPAPIAGTAPPPTAEPPIVIPVGPLPTDLPPVGADGDAPPTATPPPVAAGGRVDRVAPVSYAAGGVPSTVLSAYQESAARLAGEQPGCRLSVPLLAAIGKVESGHARGGRVDVTGRTVSPILGPVLNGGPGIAAIRDTDGGAYDGDTVWDRAVGPMQFIPSTWARWGADADGNGTRDPHTIRDAATAAGRYLCAGGRDLMTADGLRSGILSYNRSTEYLRLVLAWMATYARGTAALPDSPATGGPGGRPPTPDPRPPAQDPQRPAPPTPPPGTAPPSATPPGTTPPSPTPPGTPPPNPPGTPPPGITPPGTTPPGTTPPAPGQPLDPLTGIICTVDGITQPVTGIIGGLLPILPDPQLPGCPERQATP
ncbi:lytic transglycosylase domain-containing protein [Actinokineospora guangxiensis]|uniref:Lytic transglycosylase domain-containing protein n=1 Tax=Actinokineospora guangxiensis TaxID=1490288 RepID=A0ABW0EVJ8_9PSEU